LDIDILTVKGAGHYVPTDRPGPALQMFTNFIQNTGNYSKMTTFSLTREPLLPEYQPPVLTPSTQKPLTKPPATTKPLTTPPTTTPKKETPQASPTSTPATPTATPKASSTSAALTVSMPLIIILLATSIFKQ
uniref:Alpha/beta-hydrolase n=1 Tax=Anisakis simplex TaxID=6269 RepID=A0A0M3K7W1_ANISI